MRGAERRPSGRGRRPDEVGNAARPGRDCARGREGVKGRGVPVIGHRDGFVNQPAAHFDLMCRDPFMDVVEPTGPVVIGFAVIDREVENAVTMGGTWASPWGRAGRKWVMGR